MLVLCDEAAGIARYLASGIEVSPRTLALETIAQVGPGGNYLSESHTVENFRSSLHFSPLLNRLEHARWQEEGSATLQERANRRARAILESRRPPELPADVVRVVQAVVARRDHGG
jgi:trimethylamine--corrinoid protein Co-methyltransferase